MTEKIKRERGVLTHESVEKIGGWMGELIGKETVRRVEAEHLMNEVYTMVKETPNDLELGKKLRAFIGTVQTR